MAFSAALVVFSTVLDAQELKLIEPAPVEPVKYAASMLPGEAVKEEYHPGRHKLDLKNTGDIAETVFNKVARENTVKILSL